MHWNAIPVALCLVLSGGCAAGVSLSGPSAEPLPSATRKDFRSQETRRGIKFWPRSAPVQEGVEYSFNTGHCGLDYLTDFDGSFWDPVDPNGDPEEPYFFYNEDHGTMELLSEDEAEYTSSNGRRVRLRRHEGLCA